MKTNKKEDKYSAVWLSHSSASDFLKCPRLYFLKNIWKNDKGNKVNIVSPYLSLGLAVHQTIEPLATLKVDERLEFLSNKDNVMETFNKNFDKFRGKTGGFEDAGTEEEFKKRGQEMIQNVLNNPGPLKSKTVKYYNGDFIPNFFLSEKDNIILCGLVDWVEYLESTDSLKVIDFKTGKNDEKDDSMQLPIYKLLVENLQKRKVTSCAYWYLDRDKFPKSVEIVDEDLEEIKNKLLRVGLEIKNKKGGFPNSRFKDMEKNFPCSIGVGCRNCKEFEIIKNYVADNERIEYLGQGEYKQDLYLVKKVIPMEITSTEETGEVQTI